MLAVGCGSGVNGWLGAETRRGGQSTAFVGNACRLSDCAVADAHGTFERQGGFWGQARVVERRGRLWRRPGSSRPTGELGVGGLGVGGLWSVEGVGLIEVVAELTALGPRACWRYRWRGGRDADVVQYFRHHPRRCDQGQQDHLGLAAGALEGGNTEASHQQARPRHPSGSDRERVRQRDVRLAGVLGSARD